MNGITVNLRRCSCCLWFRINHLCLRCSNRRLQLALRRDFGHHDRSIARYLGTDNAAQAEGGGDTVYDESNLGLGAHCIVCKGDFTDCFDTIPF